jgi:hypothetical protein
MPRSTYTVEYQGKRYTLEGDREPTEKDLQSLVAPKASNPDSGKGLANAANAVGDFLGIGNYFKGAAYAFNPNRLANLALSKSKDPIYRNYGQQQLVGDQEAPVTPEQQIGSTVNLATLATSFGAGAPLTFGGRVAQGAALGAAGGVGQAMNQNANAGQVAASGALGGALGGGLTAGTEVIGNALKKGSQKTAESIYNKLIRTKPRELEAGREPLGTGLLNRKVSGNFDQMSQQLERSANASKDELNKVIAAKSGTPVDVTNVRTALEALQERSAATPGENPELISKVLNSFKGKDTLSLGEAQQLKQNLQKVVNTAFLRNNVTGTTEAQKAAAQQLRIAIEKAAPEVASLNQEIAFAIRAVPELIKKAGASPSRIRLLLDLGLGGYGLTSHNSTFGKIAGALGAADYALSNPTIATKTAQGLVKAGGASLSPAATAVMQRILASQAARGVGSLTSPR